MELSIASIAAAIFLSAAPKKPLSDAQKFIGGPVVYMPPAPAIAGGKGLRAFADCRRQTQTGKTGKKGGKYW